MRPPPRRLGSQLERLEDRSLPATFGVPWADPGHLTLGFAPDTTPTPTGASALFATLDAVAPRPGSGRCCGRSRRGRSTRT